jgi:transposase-like protein
MITLIGKLEIIALHLQNQSNRSIAKALGIDKKTVNKYVAEYECAQAALTQAEKPDKEALRKATEVATAVPEYKKRNSPARKYSPRVQYKNCECATSQFP